MSSVNIFFLFSFFTFQVLAKDIVQVFTYHDKVPFIINSKHEEGLTYNLINLLNKYSKQFEYQLKIIPRKRILLQEKQVIIWNNPSWVKIQSNYHWTSPILKDSNVILFRKDRPLDYDSKDSLKGKSLACVNGYIYKNLQDYLDNKTIKRLDVKTELNVMQMVNLRRTDAGIMSESTYNYYKVADKSFANIGDSKKRSFEFTRHVQVSKNQPRVYTDISDIISNPKFKSDLRITYDKYNLKF